MPVFELTRRMGADSVFLRLLWTPNASAYVRTACVSLAELCWHHGNKTICGIWGRECLGSSSSSSSSAFDVTRSSFPWVPHTWILGTDLNSADPQSLVLRDTEVGRCKREFAVTEFVVSDDILVIVKMAIGWKFLLLKTTLTGLSLSVLLAWSSVNIYT